MKINNKAESLKDAIIFFLKNLKVKFNTTTVVELIEGHPDYPSIASLTNLLNSLKIPNKVFLVDPELFNIANLPMPVIVQTTDSIKNTLVIKSFENNLLAHNDGKNVGFMPKEEFVRIWTGVFLYAEADAESGEQNLKLNRIKSILNGMRLPVILLTFILIVASLFPEIQITYLNIILLLKLPGLFLSILLLVHSIEGDNAIINAICGLNEKSGCKSVLNSPAAKIVFFLSWSEVGFFYFAGTLISMLVFSETIILLSILNLFGMLFTFYSIYYQIKNKTYCRLCLATVVIIWIEGLTFFIGKTGFWSSGLYLNLPVLYNLALSFLAPIAVWGYLKPFFIRAKKLPMVQKELNKFKYNGETFDLLLNAAKKVNISDDLKPILIGNPQSKHVVTIVSSPFCEPCAIVHKKIAHLVDYKDILVKIIFIPFLREEQAMVAYHLTCLGQLGKKTIAVDALNHWYESRTKSYEMLQDKFPLDLDRQGMIKLMAEQNEFVKKARITGTPTIFVNGCKLPKLYTLDDLEYMI